MRARERRLMRRCERLIACARALGVDPLIELEVFPLDTQYAGNFPALQQFHGALRALVVDATPEQRDDGLALREFAVGPALDAMGEAIADRSPEAFDVAYRDWRFAIVSTSTPTALRAWARNIAATQGYAT